MIGLALCAIFAVAVVSLQTSVQHFIVHQAARRRADAIVFPPLKTIDTSDEVPF